MNKILTNLKTWILLTVVLALMAGVFHQRWQGAEKLDLCLSQAEKDHWESWKLNCNSDIKKDENGEIESCGVPAALAKNIDDERQQDKDNCFKRYQP